MSRSRFAAIGLSTLLFLLAMVAVVAAQTPLGTAFTAPFHFQIGSIQSKDNLLEIEITSTAANRIRDLDRRQVEWRKFHDINFVNIDYKPFDASVWPLADAGLLGPVTLVPVEAFDPSSL